MSDKFQQSTFCNAKVGHEHVLCPHNAQKSFKSEREMFGIIEQEQGSVWVTGSLSFRGETLMMHCRGSTGLKGKFPF
jgi:hypothetical protein